MQKWKVVQIETTDGRPAMCLVLPAWGEETTRKVTAYVDVFDTREEALVYYEALEQSNR